MTEARMAEVMTLDTAAENTAATMQIAPAKPAYQVLARKYRPTSFADLIGQEPMVRTLTNAFALGRIHQAYILTGVRGVGKTTTARILARAFNYEVPGKVNAPSIDMPEMGVHCAAILESRHVDVIEMDAASHTGIDDVREVIENARYRPVSARTKVYIIDEVHMLSKQAFNGLLKTLEEPPEHVKFIFATTEIDKVLVTVRSRCQRFDLRRIELGVLAAHLAKICAAEHVDHDAESLQLIAKAADGSVRDSLSILDQAIAHSAGEMTAHSNRVMITADAVRNMLGMTTQGQSIALFDVLIAGDIASALALFAQSYHEGVDALQMLGDLADYTHYLTRLKLAPDLNQLANDVTLAAEVRTHAEESAQKLSVRVLSRFWQILFKGLSEVKEAIRPLAAAEMVLVRLAYAAELPTPDELAKLMGTSHAGDGGAAQRQASSVAASNTSTNAAKASFTQTPAVPNQARAQLRVTSQQLAERPQTQTMQHAQQPTAALPQITLQTFDDLIALAKSKRDITLQLALERDIGVVQFENGRLAICLKNPKAASLPQMLSKRLQEWTGRRWMIAVETTIEALSVHEQTQARKNTERHAVENHDFIQALLSHFPNAHITNVETKTLSTSPYFDMTPSLTDDEGDVLPDAPLMLETETDFD